MQAIVKFLKDEDGVTALEYAILAAAVVVLVTGLSGAFTGVRTAIINAVNTAAGTTTG